jgi:hypothetical protein
MPFKKEKYSRKTVHSLAYYKSVLLILIAGLTAFQTHQQIAERLNNAVLLTPTGKPWTASIVKESLKKLRLHRDYPNKLHHALLELIYAGELTVKQTLILFQHRSADCM